MRKTKMGRSRVMLGRYRASLKATGSVTCGICLQPITHQDDLTVDHIYPRALGGNSRMTNLQPAHSRCNSQKGNKIIKITATEVST